MKLLDLQTAPIKLMLFKMKSATILYEHIGDMTYVAMHYTY